MMPPRLPIVRSPYRRTRLGPTQEQCPSRLLMGASRRRCCSRGADKWGSVTMSDLIQRPNKTAAIPVADNSGTSLRATGRCSVSSGRTRLGFRPSPIATPPDAQHRAGVDQPDPDRRDRHHFGRRPLALTEEVRFAADSSLEEGGFEPSVPRPW
jgi:hypothetical protein